jgi:hypothetical protein
MYKIKAAGIKYVDESKQVWFKHLDQR